MIGGIRLCGLGCRRRESRAVAQPPVTLLGVRRLSEDDVRSLGTESPSAVRRELPVPGRFAAGSRVARSHSVGASSIGLPDAGAEASERALRASNAVAPALLALNARRLGLARDHYRAVFAGSAELLERGFVAQTMRPLATWLEALTGLDEDRFELCGECAKVLLPIVELLAGRNSHESAHGGQNGTSAPAATPTGLAARAYAIGALDWLLPVLSDLHAVLANHGQGGCALAETLVRTAPESGLLGLPQSFHTSRTPLALHDPGRRLLLRAAAAAGASPINADQPCSLPTLRAVSRVAERTRHVTC